MCGVVSTLRWRPSVCAAGAEGNEDVVGSAPYENKRECGLRKFMGLAL